MRPTIGANIITNTELAELFTPLGSNLMEPNKVSSKLCAANMLKEPPLYSKNAQKIIENKMNTKAAISFLDSSQVCLVIS